MGERKMIVRQSHPSARNLRSETRFHSTGGRVWIATRGHGGAPPIDGPFPNENAVPRIPRIGTHTGLCGRFLYLGSGGGSVSESPRICNHSGYSGNAVFIRERLFYGGELADHSRTSCRGSPCSSGREKLTRRPHRSGQCAGDAAGLRASPGPS